MQKIRQTQDLWTQLLKDGKNQGKTLKFLALTFDPDFDSPEVLKKYGRGHGADFSKCTLATGPPELMNSALPSLFSVMAFPAGPGNIRHTVKIALLKPGLWHLKEWGNNEVEPQEVIDLVLGNGK
jgi:protein SCO1/2